MRTQEHSTTALFVFTLTLAFMTVAGMVTGMDNITKACGPSFAMGLVGFIVLKICNRHIRATAAVATI